MAIEVVCISKGEAVQYKVTARPHDKHDDQQGQADQGEKIAEVAEHDVLAAILTFVGMRAREIMMDERLSSKKADGRKICCKPRLSLFTMSTEGIGFAASAAVTGVNGTQVVVSGTNGRSQRLALIHLSQS